jgi:peptidyl-prolyl cis-trans isomerase B (cyclophilin B)
MVIGGSPVSSSSTRQRRLARAKLDRQLARRADKLRRQRQIRAAAAGILAVTLVILGGFWLGGAFDAKPAEQVQAADCAWNTQDLSANDKLTEQGTPPTTVTKFGTSTMTLALGPGNITAQLNHNAAQCAAASLSYLAGKGYYNGTKCHELTGEHGQFALRCGDPSGSGVGGPNYTFAAESVPRATDPSASPQASATPGADPSASPAAGTFVRYPRGTIAMTSGISGSQFFVFYKDSTTSADYTVVGQVTSGLDVLDKIAAAGAVDNGFGAVVKPKEDVTIQTLTVVPDATEPTGAPAPAQDPSASPSAAAN